MHIHPGERLSGPATPLPTSGGRFPFSILRKVHKVNSGLNNPSIHGLAGEWQVANWWRAAVINYRASRDLTAATDLSPSKW